VNFEASTILGCCVSQSAVEEHKWTKWLLLYDCICSVCINVFVLGVLYMWRARKGFSCNSWCMYAV